MNRRMFLLLFVIAVSCSQSAGATNPGDRTFTALGSGSLGQAASVGAAGNLALSLPLSLPSPRGALPLPFSVSYDGANTVGAAGVGWDIPIFGVTRQHNLSRRKPVHRFSGEAEPATADRVFVDIGGGPMLMAPTAAPGVFQPFESGYFELRCSGAACNGHDAEGRRWVFEQLPALVDDDFFALVRIEDASGVNRVDLHYDVFDKFSTQPIITPQPDQISARELVLRELEYSHDAGGSCPKYRIQLTYSVFSQPIGFEFVTGRPRTRSRLLQSIKLLTSADPSCAADAERSEAVYRIGYTGDPLTGLPRLANVDMLGPQDGVTLGSALPVVSYRYGTAVTNGALRYSPAEQISLPAGPAGANRGLAATLGGGGGSLYGHIRGFQDLNGDGRADFVTLNAQGQKPVLAVNRPSALGNDFSTLPAVLTLPNASAAPYNLGAPDLSFGLPVAETIDNTYQELLDFNGDGRPDILVATDGRNDHNRKDPNFWKVLINQPGPSGQPGDIVWLERNVDISALRSAVMARHVLSPVSSSDQNAKPLPLERTHNVGAFDHNTVVESAVVTQWKLLDVNGDGFPDFVFDSNGITAQNEQRCDAAGSCREVLRQDHEADNHLMVIYHTGPMMAGSGAETQNVWRGPAVLLRHDGACGVSRLTFMGGGRRQLQCGFMEVNGDGLPDYVIADASGVRAIRSSGLDQAHDELLPENRIPDDFAAQELKRSLILPGPVGVVKDPRAQVCADASGSTAYQIEQISGLRDITGDGIADYVFFGGPELPPGNPEGRQGWWYMAGTGVGFINPRSIQAPGNVPFALHISQERCDGQFSNVIADLLDLDGDGRPEIVRSPNAMNVLVAKLTSADGTLGAYSAGQVTTIDNRYGAVTEVRYGSAKSDWLGRQDVPFPQIVVTEMEQTAAYHLGASLAPVRFGYGSPEQVYHPLLGRFVFRGYGRRVEVEGEPTAHFGQLKGTAQITATIAAGQFPASQKELMLAGRPREIRVLAGTVPADPRRLLGSLAPFTTSAPSVERALLTWKVKTLPGAVPPLVPLEEECYAAPPPKSPGAFGDLTLCRRTAAAFVSDQETSEGQGAFPQPNNVATLTSITAVDDYARPLQVRLAGDRRRSDDDLCLQLAYAAPAPGAPLILNVPRSIRSYDCVHAGRFLSGVRYEYDDLPAGQARFGRASSRVLERRNTTTGELLESVPSARLRRDVFGNPIEVTRTRADGATNTTTVDYDPFGLMPVRSEATASGLATPLVTTTQRQPFSLLPLTVTGTNGAAIHNTFDHFNRLKRVSLSLPDDPERYLLVDVAMTGFDGAPTGRTVRYKIFHRFVPESAAANPPADAFTVYTAVFDEFTRQMHGILDLGPDYDGRKLIVDSVSYDALGRPKFAAAPFPADLFGPRYGTTFTYRADGRPECMIDGTGPQTDLTTDETLDRYVTCVSDVYRDGQLLVRTRGPNEMAAGKPQSGAFDQEAFSATGQLLSRARIKRATILELAEYGYDRLGSPASLTRYAQPGRSATKTLWTWTNDSLGNVLEATEPAGIKRQYSYDSLGHITAVSWRDSTGIAALERGLKFSYDGLERLVRAAEMLNGVEQPESVREYFYDLPAEDSQPHPEFLNGRLSYARSGGRETALGYDALGRVTWAGRSQSGERFIERSILDAAGDPLQLEFEAPGQPERAIRYSYDSARRLQAVEFEEAAQTSEVWRALQTDIFGHVLRSRRGNGAIEEFTYKDGGRRELLSKRINVNGEIRLLSFSGFDGAMMLKGFFEQSNITPLPPTTTQYSYDARNALTRALVQNSNGTVSDFSYSYDGLGNLTAVTDAVGTGSLEIHPDKFDPDRICSVTAPDAPAGPCRYRYDGAGNVRAAGSSGTFFEYDGWGRLRSGRSGVHQAELEYDPFGSLASLRLTDGQTEERESFFGAVSRAAFFDGAGNPLTVDSGGTPLLSFTELSIPSPLGQVAALRGSDTGARTMLYPVGEAQGMRMVLDGNGAATQSVAYDAYGGAAADTGTPATLTYWPYEWNGGHVLSGLGLTAIGDRVYDSRTGRFLQRDPMMNAASAVTAHPYAFAWDNPAAFIDLTGTEPANRGDAGVGDLASAMGRFIQSQAFRPGAKTDPYIDTSFACDFDHNCMRAVEEATGALTEFEQELRTKYHVTKKGTWRLTDRYYVVKDRLSGAVLGYAFYTNNLEVYDRSGKEVAVLNNERALEAPWLDPVDFAGAGIGGFLRKKISGVVARDVGTAIESELADSEGPAAVAGGPPSAPVASPPTNLPPWQWGNPASFSPGSYGYTTWVGDIYLNPTMLRAGTPQFFRALRHEGVHRFLSPRGGLFSGARAGVRRWFYAHSHLLRYTEEAWAETAASGSLRTGLRYPFKYAIQYNIRSYRLVLEGTAAVGATYGGYKLADSLWGPQDR